MELKKEMFFDEDGELETSKVVRMIMENSSRGEEIINFIGDVMEDEYEYKFEKKWLEMKYKHDMKELKEKYGYDLDD